MTAKVLLVLALAAAVSVTPLAALAHQGHDHGVKTKKVKKSKPKKAAIDVIVPPPMVVSAQDARVWLQQNMQLSDTA